MSNGYTKWKPVNQSVWLQESNLGKNLVLPVDRQLPEWPSFIFIIKYKQLN